MENYKRVWFLGYKYLIEMLVGESYNLMCNCIYEEILSNKSYCFLVRKDCYNSSGAVLFFFPGWAHTEFALDRSQGEDFRAMPHITWW